MAFDKNHKNIKNPFVRTSGVLTTGGARCIFFATRTRVGDIVQAR